MQNHFVRMTFPVISDVYYSHLVILTFLVASTTSNVATVVRPETVLLELLAKPFAPQEWASTECRHDSVLYLNELENYTPWALKMFDSSVKVPSGLITGNYQQLGNYDECLSIKTQHGFVGQACSATVQFEITKNNGTSQQLDVGDLLLNVAKASNATNWKYGSSVFYEWMWCVPSSCNHSEIQEALEIALDPLKVEGRVDMVVDVPKHSCHTVYTDEAVYNVFDWIYISILAIFALIIIASTSYDVIKHKQSSVPNKDDTRHSLLISFSLYTNCKNLLNTERHKESIKCLDGLRYFSICWIIYGHTHYSEVVGVKLNLMHVNKMHHDWSTMLVLNGNIVTDTFFLLTGILVAYTELLKKQKDVNWQFDIFGLYIHRYIRLTPAYAMMIGFYATLLYKFGSGPHWDMWVGNNSNFCRKNWWTNLLYINNYIDIPSMCMSQSWYLATDMQLIWLSPIFLYPMLKFTCSTFFWIVFVVGLILSILLPFFVTFFLSLTGTMLYYKDLVDVGNVYTYIYTRVYTRFGPYIIGLGMGYILHKTRSYTVKIPMLYVILGWLIAITCGLLAVFGVRGLYFDNHPYNKTEASFYAGFHRHVFVLAISWVIFASVHGYAGIINYLLSWHGWVPFSKLTYCAYLTHYVFLLSRAGNVRIASDLTTMNVVRTFFANLVLTMGLSVVWSLCFEMPFMALDRALLSRRYRSKLFIKSKHSKIFGSMDSGKEICHSSEEALPAMSQTFAIIHQDKLNNDNVYNSSEDANYRDEEKKSAQKVECSYVNNDERSSNYIYVIDTAETSNDITKNKSITVNDSINEEINRRAKVNSNEVQGFGYVSESVNSKCVGEVRKERLNDLEFSESCYSNKAIDS